MSNYVVIESMKDVTKNFVGENKMTKNEAKLELFKVNRMIEKKIEQYSAFDADVSANMAVGGQGWKDREFVYAQLKALWAKKSSLNKIIFG